MRNMIIIACLLASMSIQAQSKKSVAPKQPAPAPAAAIEWAIVPAAGDTVAYKFTGQDAVVRKPAEFAKAFTQLYNQSKALVQKTQLADVAFGLVNLNGQVINLQEFLKVMAYYRQQ